MGEITMSNKEAPFQPSLAVSTVFEQAKPLHEQLAQIAFILEPMNQLSGLANVFEPLREFEVKIAELAQVLEPMHNFQDQLRRVLKQFTPLQALDQELDQLSAAFAESLSQLAAALEPAAQLQDRLAHLAVAFEPAKSLSQEFSTLAQSFERRPEGLPQ
jgi:DNA repair ATPase RecN